MRKRLSDRGLGGEECTRAAIVPQPQPMAWSIGHRVECTRAAIVPQPQHSKPPPRPGRVYPSGDCPAATAKLWLHTPEHIYVLSYLSFIILWGVAVRRWMGGGRARACRGIKILPLLEQSKKGAGWKWGGGGGGGRGWGRGRERTEC